MKRSKNKHAKITLLLIVVFSTIVGSVMMPQLAHAAANQQLNFAEITPQEVKIDPDVKTTSACGSGTTEVKTVIDIGCKGKGNGILDLSFAIIRFLTLGASLVMIGSTIAAGIQFTASRGDPQATSAALKRMASTASALLLFIFAYAILNWLVPNTLLR